MHELGVQYSFVLRSSADRVSSCQMAHNTTDERNAEFIASDKILFIMIRTLMILNIETK